MVYAWLGRIIYTVFGWLIWAIFIRATIRPRVLVICDGQILLTKTWIGQQNWEIPGGGKMRKEDEKDAVVRELKEETGIQISSNKLKFLKTGAISQRGSRYLTSYWLASIDTVISPKTNSIMILESKWFNLSELPHQLSGQDKQVINSYAR